MPNDYQVWLEKHNRIIEKAKALIEKYGFKVVVIKDDRKPSFLRIHFGKNNTDFRIKIVKTKFVRSIWLCKKERFSPKSFYLLYATKEKCFSIATGSDINQEHELKNSEWAKGVKYVVVQITMFRPAKTFFKLMKTRYEGELQKRMNEWF